MPCQSLRTSSVVFLDLAINSFLSRTILVFNSVPFRLLSLSSQSSPLCIRLDILNVYSTISSIHSNPSFVSTLVFPTFLSAIFNFYHLAFVNVLSYPVPITFNLFSTRFFNVPTHPPLPLSSPIVVNRHRRSRFRRRGDRAWR